MPNRVRGLRLTTSNLHRLGVNVEVMVGPVLTSIGERVAEDMRANVRKDTERLERSITVGKVEWKRKSASIKIGPSKKGWYARFLEFGTRIMGAFPFIRPARDRIRPEIKPRMRRGLKKGLKVG